MTAPRPTKTCAVCGRAFTWRKKWARDWEKVEVCSDRCRAGRRALATLGTALEDAILRLLAGRARGATICPSEAARAVGDGEGWRELMEPAREAARRLVARGEIEVTQGGRVVAPESARGAIRLRLVESRKT